MSGWFSNKKSKSPVDEMGVLHYGLVWSFINYFRKFFLFSKKFLFNKLNFFEGRNLFLSLVATTKSMNKKKMKMIIIFIVRCCDDCWLLLSFKCSILAFYSSDLGKYLTSQSSIYHSKIYWRCYLHIHFTEFW